METYHNVPSADSADNVIMSDVIGNKTDTHDGDSIYSLVVTIKEHHNTSSKVIPSLATGITVTSDGAAWTLGNFSNDIVAANAITHIFDIHNVSVENISANAVYELVLYYGATDIECGRVRFVKNAVQDGTMNVPIQSCEIPANSRVRAKVADSTGGNNVTISLFYYEY